jgi:hypothetical protein
MSPFRYTLPQLLSVMDWKGYYVYTVPYRINIVGIRSADHAANTFDDWIVVWRTAPEPKFWWFPATTDPGVNDRENPMNVDGTAIVVPGQYVNLWRIGLHRGQYKALVQVGDILVWRDSNKDQMLNAGPPQQGRFGINLHRARAGGTSTQVDKWSAGCQVLASSSDHDLVMMLAEEQVALAGVDLFTYTLIDEVDMTLGDRV